MDASSLRTVSQLADELPAFSEPALRRLIFDAETNGMNNAVVRVRRRVYIDIKEFNRWLETHRGRSPQVN